ncbi:MAG: hypothetical protein IKL16_02875, partial [Clostridia bacterium]|nr:hypothetical protein [Clostridia bacterium]
NYNLVQNAECKVQNVGSATQIYNDTNGNTVGDGFPVPNNFLLNLAGGVTHPLRYDNKYADKLLIYQTDNLWTAI